MPATVTLLGILLICAACTSNDLVICTAQFVPGIVVEVQDSVSGASRVQGAQGAVHDGPFLDSLRPHSPTSLQAAGERPGTYNVTLSHAGYADWVRTGVQVERGVCHVQTVTLQALLQPSP